MYLLKIKDKSLERFILYKTEVENRLSRKIQLIRSAPSSEYVTSIGNYCEQQGIRHEVTPPYSPQSNGVAKRKNRTLKEMMNAMLISFRVPQKGRSHFVDELPFK